MITITLTEWEYKQCVDVATTRMSVSIGAKLTDIAPDGEIRSYKERLIKDIVGVCGEVAVAKAAGLYWSPTVNTFHGKPDIEPNLEVRTTENPARADSDCLIVRDNDPDERVYIMVTGEPPVMTIRGWIRGSDAKKDCYLRNPGGHRRAWFVPQEDLKTFKKGA